MDIVSRLKIYMDYAQIAISQFADTCNIPRPTISQILNGRNKKISDELIGKIHTAFPDLSVVWLMFGEGPMLTGSNIKTSEPENSQRLTFDDDQTSEHEMFVSEREPLLQSQEIPPIRYESDTMRENSIKHDISTSNRTPNEISEVISGKIETSKKITSIVVFYADNTFQTFNPS